MKEDTRIVMGARCTWWDTIDKVGRSPNRGPPCCPYCGGMLFEVESPAKWWEGVDAYDAGHPGYRAFAEWGQGKCLPGTKSAKEAFEKETGKTWI